MNTIARFVSNDSAATAIEYGMIAFFIAGVIVVAVNALGVSVLGDFTAVSTSLK
jgi:pilus assembly protein Flp/PilA